MSDQPQNAAEVLAQQLARIYAATTRATPQTLRAPKHARALIAALREAAGSESFTVAADGSLLPAGSSEPTDALFQTGDFTLASGAKSSWKIECDVLTEADWDGLAAMAAPLLPTFREVHGVPRGGIPFAKALAPYRSGGLGCVLLADDVWTTGESMQRFADATLGRDVRYFGVVAFARNLPPSWVASVFTMGWTSISDPPNGDA